MSDGNRAAQAYFKGLEKRVDTLAREAVREAAETIADAAGDLAPRDTGELAESPKVRAGGRSRKGPTALVVVEDRDEPGKPAAVEYGTSETAGTPFLRPAVDRNAARVKAGALAHIARGLTR